MSIRNLREQAGMQQKELADKLNIGRSTLSQYETGQRRLDSETAKKIADFFEVSLDEVYGYTPKEKTPPADAEDVTFDDFSYAMHNEGQSLTPAQKEALLDMARRFNQYLDNEEKKG